MNVIVTFCKALDDMLNGGVQLGQVTEFCGVPGVGKTQMCMQLAADVQIPLSLGGVDGEAVYIDTEGSFVAERQQQIAEAVSRHLSMTVAVGVYSAHPMLPILHPLHVPSPSPSSQKQGRRVAKAGASRGVPAVVVPSTDTILSRIHVIRCCDAAELSAAVHFMPTFVADHPRVKLLVIDSIAFHFRHDQLDSAARARHLSGTAQALRCLAAAHNVAVCILLLPQHLTELFSSEWGAFCAPSCYLHILPPFFHSLLSLILSRAGCNYQPDDDQSWRAGRQWEVRKWFSLGASTGRVVEPRHNEQSAAVLARRAEVCTSCEVAFFASQYS
jgi:RecA/RadA recombinase